MKWQTLEGETGNKFDVAKIESGITLVKWASGIEIVYRDIGEIVKDPELGIKDAIVTSFGRPSKGLGSTHKND